MAVIGSLSVKLGLVTVDWDKATAKAAREAKDLQKKFDELEKIEEKTGPIYLIHINIYKLKFDVLRYSLYDVIYLPELIKKILKTNNIYITKIIPQISCLVNKYKRNEVEEDEEVEDEIGFKDRDYDKNSTEYDPFDKLSGQIKNQIATTLFEKEDKFGNMSMGQKYKLYIKLFNLSNIE